MNLDKTKRVLVAVAHPDDEALGCGGTIARMVEVGMEVRVLVPFYKMDERGKKHEVALNAGLVESCSILGATVAKVERSFPDFSLDVPNIADAIRPHAEWADLVLTHWIKDTHVTHRSLSDAVNVATRPFRNGRDVWHMETVSCTDQNPHDGFVPQIFVPLTEAHVEKKLRAIAPYKSEIVSPRDVDTLQAQLIWRGGQGGFKYAECFRVVRGYWGLEDEQ